MGRIIGGAARKGSRKWLQKVVNDQPEVLNWDIAKALGWKTAAPIHWVSPLKDDDYAEYRDKAFVDILKLDLKKVALEDFWPSRGACWDGLGKTDDGRIFLVEAKAHIREILTPPTGAKNARSLGLIKESLEATRMFVHAKGRHDWSMTFYQYTNRLAHLYFLRELNDIPAYLVFVYFVNDNEMDGPNSEEEWQGAIKLVHSYLGVRRNRLSRYIIELFIDVQQL